MKEPPRNHGYAIWQRDGAALAMKRDKSVDFTGYWQRHIEARAAMFFFRLLMRGPHALYAGLLLRRKARAAGQYPYPMKPDFLIDLASAIASRRRTASGTIESSTSYLMERAQARLAEPSKPVDRHHPIDALLDSHKMASLPKIVVVQELPSTQMAALQRDFDDIMRGKYS